MYIFKLKSSAEQVKRQALAHTLEYLKCAQISHKEGIDEERLPNEQSDLKRNLSDIQSIFNIYENTLKKTKAVIENV